MEKTRLGKVALGFSVVAFLFTFIAFITSSWLVTDGQIADPKFENIGLWFVCFKNFEDIRHWHDSKYGGCRWVYQDEYYILHEFLLPGFYVAVQFFFTICFIILLIAGILAIAYLCTSKQAENFVCLLYILGGDLLAAGICGSIACILFGIYGDSRFWMPHWEHNNMGYSYWFACIGTVSSYIAGLCFLVESRKHKIKRNFLYNRE